MWYVIFDNPDTELSFFLCETGEFTDDFSVPPMLHSRQDAINIAITFKDVNIRASVLSLEAFNVMCIMRS